MKKVVLLCASGMSTSVLVKKMKEACEKEGLQYDINAYSIVEASDVGKDADIILLGPQVKYQLEKIKTLVNCPVKDIDMQAYGMMNGKKVIQDVKNIIGE